MRFVHISSEIVALGNKAPPEQQAHFDNLIRAKLIRDVTDTPSGRVGRTKGVTYHRMEHRRHEARAIIKAFPYVVSMVPV